MVMYIKENISDLANIHKDNSNQIITDFERTITNCNNETKLLFKKVQLPQYLFVYSGIFKI